MAVIRKVEGLPFTLIPFVLVPFYMAYMFDYAYLSKGDRISAEALKIREQETQWFNEPLDLPLHMKPYYESLVTETNQMLQEVGAEPEKGKQQFTDF
jgi:hypothetical protein